MYTSGKHRHSQGALSWIIRKRTQQLGTATHNDAAREPRRHVPITIEPATALWTMQIEEENQIADLCVFSVRTTRHRDTVPHYHQKADCRFGRHPVTDITKPPAGIARNRQLRAQKGPQ